MQEGSRQRIERICYFQFWPSDSTPQADKSQGLINHLGSERRHMFLDDLLDIGFHFRCNLSA